MKESRNWLKYVTWLLFALALLGVVLVGAVIGLRYYVRRGMTPAEIAEMKAFFEEPVKLPAEWQKVEPFPEDVVLAGDRLRSTWIGFGEAKPGEIRAEFLQRLGRGEELRPAEWERAEESLRVREEYIEALIALVSLPDYEMDAFPADEPISNEPGNTRLPRTAVGFEYLLLRTHALRKSGNYAEAFNTCIAALRLFRHHPATTVVNHMIAIGGRRETCRTILQLGSTCEDAETLEAALRELNRLAPQRNACDLNDPRLLDWVGILRELAREGESVDLSSGQTRADILEQLRHIWDQREGRRGTYLDNPLLGQIFAELMYKSFLHLSGPIEMAKKDRLLSLPVLDLTRLALTFRIVELQTGAKPTSMDDLVPEYFPEPLMDPFSNQPYLWSDRWKTFYSVGPNKTPELDSMILNSEGDFEGGDDIVASRGTRTPPPRPGLRSR